jgi:Tol biopolymer transport system component
MSFDVADVAPRKRRGLQFSLRTLLFAVAILGVGGAWLSKWAIERWRAQERAAAVAAAKEAIEKIGRIMPRRGAAGERVYFTGPAFDDQRLRSVVAHLEILQPAEIDLVRCPITDDGLDALTSLTDLKAVYVHQTKATPHGIGLLKQALPNAIVRITAPDPVASGLVMKDIFRHAIVRVAYSPAGKRIVAGDGHGTLFVWDADTGDLEHETSAHESWLFTLAFSPDGRLLATGGGDATIRLWDTTTWQLRRELAGHSDDIHAVAFTPDGRRLASAGDDRTIRIWDTHTGDQQRCLTGHTGAITSLAVSPDGETIASASRDSTIRLWQRASGKLLRTFAGHADDVMSVAFRPDGAELASASYDRTVKLWPLANDSQPRTLAGHTHRVYGVSYSPGGQQLVSSAGDGTIRLWNVGSGAELRVIDGPTDLSSVAWHPTRQQLTASSAEGCVLVYEADSGARLAALWGHHPQPPDLIASQCWPRSPNP